MKQVLVCGLLALAMVLTAAAADVSGKWSGTYAMEGGAANAPAFMILKQAGGVVTGTAGADEGQQLEIQGGKIQGNKVTVQVTTDAGVTYKCDMTLEGDRLKGEILVSRDGQSAKGKIDVARVK